MPIQKALIGAGCFWGVQEYFNKINGIISTRVGYSGGFKEDPTYEEVCSGNTGHAESILLVFDENLINYNNLLDCFWECHDPTQLNRQGPDIGSQYRSAIFYLDEKQKEIATKSKKKIFEKLNQSIATEISQAKTFFDAEAYHQDYIYKSRIIKY